MEDWNATPCIFMSVHSNKKLNAPKPALSLLGTSKDIIMAYMHALPKITSHYYTLFNF